MNKDWELINCHIIVEIGRMLSEEGLEIIGVPTSEAKELAQSLGIPLMEISDVKSLDITIDGADEFDSHFSLIKGGGGALTREKIVANLSKSMIVVADESKRVDVLGKFNLPVEVSPEKYLYVIEEISNICPGKVLLRRKMTNTRDEDKIYVTDNDGYILDCEFGPTITNPVNERTYPVSMEYRSALRGYAMVFVASTSGVDIAVNPKADFVYHPRPLNRNSHSEGRVCSLVSRAPGSNRRSRVRTVRPAKRSLRGNHIPRAT